MIRNLDIGDALSALRPNCEYMLEGENYSGITWLDKNQTLPTEKEVELKLVEIKYQEEVNVYREKRKLEYPDWADQLDQIYHNGIDAWKADVKAIKNKYPKIIKEVRGKGLLIGLCLHVNQAKFIQKLLDNNLLSVRAAENVVRLLPPLNVTKSEINLGLKIIEKVCKKF